MKLKKEIKNKIKNVILKLTLYYKIDRIKLIELNPKFCEFISPSSVNLRSKNH